MCVNFRQPQRSWGQSGGRSDGPSEISEPLNNNSRNAPGRSDWRSQPSKGKGMGKGKGDMVEDGPRSLGELDLETALKRLLCLSAVQCSAGLLAIVSGIIALIYAWPMKQFPGASAVPIWAGAIVRSSPNNYHSVEN